MPTAARGTARTKATRSDAPLSSLRWSLLLGGRERVALRVAKAAISGLVAAALAIALSTWWVAVTVGVVSVLVFYVAGEGSAARPMGLQAFTLGRLGNEMVRHWHYGVCFVLAGGAFGAVLSACQIHGHPVVVLTWAWAVALGTVAGSLLGTMVPAMYETCYRVESDLQGAAQMRLLSSMLLSALCIGVVSGVTLAVTLEIALHRRAAVIAIPVCTVLAVIDAVLLPAAAIVLWALRRRGPLRVGRLLHLADDLDLARTYAINYFLQHDELRRFLAQQDD